MLKVYSSSFLGNRMAEALLTIPASDFRDQILRLAKWRIHSDAFCVVQQRLLSSHGLRLIVRL